MNVPSQSIPVHFADLCNFPLRDPGPEQFHNEHPLGEEFILSLLGLPPGRPPENHTLRLLSCKRLLCPLADKISLNFRREAKSECQYLALNILAQPVIILDGPHSALFRHTDIENLHNHEETASHCKKKQC